jgi:uncharacterized FlaG/YvyC family protein
MAYCVCKISYFCYSFIDYFLVYFLLLWQKVEQQVMNDKESYVINAMMITFRKSPHTVQNVKNTEEAISKQIQFPVTIEFGIGDDVNGTLVRVWDFKTGEIRRYIPKN